MQTCCPTEKMLSCILSWKSCNFKVIRKNWPTVQCNINLILRGFLNDERKCFILLFQTLVHFMCRGEKVQLEELNYHLMYMLTKIYTKSLTEKRIKNEVCFSQLLLVSRFIIKSCCFLRHDFHLIQLFCILFL